jgi:hypothetical protein
MTDVVETEEWQQGEYTRNCPGKIEQWHTTWDNRNNGTVQRECLGDESSDDLQIVESLFQGNNASHLPFILTLVSDGHMPQLNKQ